jgi:hypothetical protein
MRKCQISDQAFTLFSFFIDALLSLVKLSFNFEGNLIQASFERVSQKTMEMKRLTHFAFDISRNPIDLDYLSVFMEQLARTEL